MSVGLHSRERFGSDLQPRRNRYVVFGGRHPVRVARRSCLPALVSRCRRRVAFGAGILAAIAAVKVLGSYSFAARRFAQLLFCYAQKLS